jgi:hypothetical protein
LIAKRIAVRIHFELKEAASRLAAIFDMSSSALESGAMGIIGRSKRKVGGDGWTNSPIHAMISPDLAIGRAVSLAYAVELGIPDGAHSHEKSMKPN